MNKWNELKQRVDTALNEAGMDDIDVQVIDVDRSGKYEITVHNMHGEPSLAVRVKGAGELLVERFGPGRLLVAMLLGFVVFIALAAAPALWA